MQLRRLFALLVLLAPSGLAAQAIYGQGYQVKYVRDSEEYPTLVRMIYGMAEQSVRGQLEGRRAPGPWAVALDVDETVLDNSTYELERAMYGIPPADESWDAWVERRAAGAVPGVRRFVTAVRQLGGRVAYISNRSERVLEATRGNLAAQGLLEPSDRVCLKSVSDSTDTKASRRDALVRGQPRCGWPGEPVEVLAWIGDALGDIPSGAEAASEQAGEAGRFGARYFLIPNPMYGGWTRRVTRVQEAP